ncbi:GNAT family N-acetyltransferase [Nocardia sp. CDC159]|uniref:GNAT family N-acetyltransferase n=1 Tax=Nocardia pulmonis TaxID=2951408 RepID=A0A9X2EAE5_9NOCA|nr:MULTISPECIES: GNAT family N-acetyltransferase [Nocardia]MCM6774493.1 GNAT family N-acetyltransferase [Nocardia pulmonis]MCM6787441.1 GNAT family N-acetyltransferase [Nocardia sp. CDC159]
MTDLASTASIRRLTPTDWPILRDIRLRALADAPSAFGATLLEARARTEQQWHTRLRDRAVFIATLGDTAVGTIAATASPEHRTAHLISTWVAPEARGTGIADQLIYAVIDWAIATGHTAIRLEVSDPNIRAERLYLRHGFTRTGRHGIISPDDPRPEFEMTLHLH